MGEKLSITVLLATFNGERYLSEQLDSIFAQTEQDLRVIASDDGSSDATFNILSRYERLHSGKMKITSNNPPHGAKYNFLNLMIANKDDYVMLCDQDDIWLNNKVEVTLNYMRIKEAKYGVKTPILVHTDLRVVDKNLRLVDSSYRHMMDADYRRTSLSDLIIQNNLTGCTAMYNKALADLIAEMPNYCVMHDWWLMLTAASFGRIEPLCKQTMLYRQHGGNEVGVRKMCSLPYMFNMALSRSAEIKQAINETYLQAESFMQVFGYRLNAAQLQLVREYVDIPNHCKMKRILMMYKLRTVKKGFLRQLGQIVFG